MSDERQNEDVLVSLKYKKDYRMDVEETSSGKKKQTLVYTGPLYSYKVIKPDHVKERTRILILTIVAAVLFILGISFYSNLSRVWYVSIPYACNALVLYFLIESLFIFWKYRTELNREQKERGGERIKAMSFVSMVLFGFSLSGSFIALVTGYVKLSNSDCFFLSFVLALVLLMFVLYRFSKDIQYIEKENPVAKEWENK